MIAQTNTTIDFEYWVSNLDVAKTRALASQAGIAGWHSLSVEKLRNKLIGNEAALAVYVANFGETN